MSIFVKTFIGGFHKKKQNIGCDRPSFLLVLHPNQQKEQAK